MRDADRDNKVYENGAGEARGDLIGERVFTAIRIGHYEQSLLSIQTGSRSLWVDARAFERHRNQGAQAKDGDRDDGEPHPTQRRRVYHERDDERVR